MAGMSPPSPRWLPAGLAGRLEERELLGEGGFGRVVLAWDRELDREVAVKVLRASLPDLEFRARFEREAKVTAALRHPHVVGVLDFGVEEDGTAWIVYERVPGVSLASLASRGPLPASRVVPWLRQLAAALGAAHAQGVVHRDLKPENVMIREDDTAVLLDFGIACREQGSTVVTAEGRVLGTPAYMAPEAILDGEVTPATDQFALGVLGYRLVSGRLPWGAGISERLAVLRAGTPPAPLEAPDPEVAGLEPVLRRAMDPRPGSRFPDLAGMIAALERGSPTAAATVRIEVPPSDLPGMATSALPQAASASVLRPGNRTTPAYPRRLALGVGALLALTWLAWPREKPPAPSVEIPPRREPDATQAPKLPGLATLRGELESLAPRLRRPNGESSGLALELADIPGLASLQRELPSLARVRAELARAGTGDGLPESVRDEVMDLDQWFDELGFEPPFAPLLPPARDFAPVPLPGQVQRIAEELAWLESGMPRVAPGWAGIAARELGRSLELRQDLGVELTAGRADSQLPALLANLRPLTQFAEDPMSTLASGVLRIPADRAVIATWLRPATLAFRRAIWAASAAASGTDGAWAGLLLHLRPNLTSALLLSPALFGEEAAWLAPGPDGPARDLIAGIVLFRTAQILQRWTEPYEARMRAGLLRLARASRVAGDDPVTRRLRGAALLERIFERSSLLEDNEIQDLLLPLEAVAARLHPLDLARALIDTLKNRVRVGALGDQALVALAMLRGLDTARLTPSVARARANLEADLAAGRVVIPGAIPLSLHEIEAAR